jgi:hypothetical protein
LEKKLLNNFFIENSFKSKLKKIIQEFGCTLDIVEKALNV